MHWTALRADPGICNSQKASLVLCMRNMNNMKVDSISNELFAVPGDTRDLSLNQKHVVEISWQIKQPSNGICIETSPSDTCPITTMSALSSTLPSPIPTRQSSPKPISPRDITSPSQIAAQLALLTRREADLSLALNALISDRGQIDSALFHLRELGGEVDHLIAEVDGHGPSHFSQVQAANGISSRGLGLQNTEDVFMEDQGGLLQRIEKVWETSERVGGKVRRLDEEVGRVREATDIVTEVLELKVCFGLRADI